IGACSSPSGTPRRLLRLPVGLTRGLEEIVNGGHLLSTALVADPSFQDTRPASFSELFDEDGQPLDEEIVKRIREEQRAALAWSSRQRSPLYFGPCEDIAEVVRRVFGNSVRSVSISDFDERTIRIDVDDDDDDDEDGD